MLTRNLARLLDIDEGLARRCVFAWTPRAGIFAGPLAGRQLSVTRATQQTVLQDDGRYYTLPNNALDPSGGIFMDLTNRAYYAHDCSRDLTGLTAGDALDSPVSGSTAYTLVEDNSTGEHKRSATCANLASGNQATSFCLKAGTREYFYIQVGNAAGSLRVRAKMRWVNGVPVFQSWDNAGSLSPSPVLFVRRLWNDWWLITLFWSTTNTDPLLIAFGGTDASGGLSYAGNGSTILAAFWQHISRGGMGRVPHVFIPTTNTTATKNADVPTALPLPGPVGPKAAVIITEGDYFPSGYAGGAGTLYWSGGSPTEYFWMLFNSNGHFGEIRGTSTQNVTAPTAGWRTAHGILMTPATIIGYTNGNRGNVVATSGGWQTQAYSSLRIGDSTYQPNCRIRLALAWSGNVPGDRDMVRLTGALGRRGIV